MTNLLTITPRSMLITGHRVWPLSNTPRCTLLQIIADTDIVKTDTKQVLDTNNKRLYIFLNGVNIDGVGGVLGTDLPY